MERFLEYLQINTTLARDILVRFVRDEVQRNGFERVVLGVSGGIDSALSAFIAAEALGPQNVLGIQMPHSTSNPSSFADGTLVIEHLGICHDQVDISPMVDPLIERFPDMTPVRRGNVMARQRMIVLYDQSMAFNGLVAGTSNKTEALLGYTTLFGDSAAAFQPIGDLYKNQVRQLSQAMGVPQPIIDKAPSADLWEGQTDEGELGYTYDMADQALYLLVDLRYTVEECVAVGFERRFIENVWQRVRRNHYKRTVPNVAKLSGRTLGHDFLYLRSWSAG